MHIAPGTIQQRIPRPLTNKERKRLRKENGGDATTQDLEGLAAAFAKPTSPKNRTQVESKDSNGWTR